MQLESHVHSDVGKKRDKNEDSYLVSDRSQLFVVADGMGGHQGGEIASQLAVQTIEQVMITMDKDPDATLEAGSKLRPGDFVGWLGYAVRVASKKVFEKAMSDSNLRGMGTTSVVMLFRGNKVFVANVGDSRGYRIRNNKIYQLTEDHSLVSEQLRAGMLKPDEVKSHRLKNIITRSVGFQGEVDVDIDVYTVKPGDLYLLCTDGLTNLVRDSEIFDILSKNSLKNGCQQLVAMANERGGEDNITALLVTVVSVEDEEEEETTLQI